MVSLNPDNTNLDLSEAEVNIGRQKGACTFAIEYQYISQQHCKVLSLFFRTFITLGSLFVKMATSKVAELSSSTI